jgi:2,4-dienoyl-CoA reductase-like NADH-dependent reductase (Old Yellow Enzyme family)/thioredoxin reductase
MSKYKKMFTPAKINRLELKNRIIKAPQTTGMGGKDGTVTERLIRYYAEQAKGGAGLIIVGYAWVDNQASKSAQCQIGIADNEFIPGLAWLAQTIQANGAKAGIQIEHCGRQKFLGTPPIKAPSRIPWEELHAMGGAIPEELTFEEVIEIIEAFGDAAVRAQMAGFDMVEVHGAHGYLITNFLSPRTNKRTDWYGGSLENRMRFLMQIIHNIRSKVGQNYPLSVRLSGSEYEPDGITIEETIEVAKALEKAGVDVLHISGGNHHQMAHQVTPMCLPPAYNTWAAETIKKEVSIPVIASGSINTPDIAEEILETGKADFVALGRPLFADPYFPQKAKDGKPEDIAPCIRCNDGCLERSFFRFQSIRCTVNPRLGKEGYLEITAAKHPKRVAVVGGGPAGMQAAVVSALRGHNVILFESNKLGGRLIEAAVPDFKADIRHLISYLSVQIKKLNIKVEYRNISPGDIKKDRYDTVIVAVGAKLRKPDIPGITKPIVKDCLDVLNGKADLGQKVIIMGAGLVGIDVGLFVAEQGKEISFIMGRENPSEFLDGIDAASRPIIAQRLSKHKYNLYAGRRLEAVQDNAVTIIDKFGNKEQLPADTVVIAKGFVAQQQYADELRSLVDIPVLSVGDCVAPRKIFDAIHEGFLAGCLV